jgi:hypothetical protein
MNKRNIVVLIVVIIGIVASFLVWKYTAPAQFNLEIISRPRNILSASTKTIVVAGQRVVFLAFVEDEERFWQGSFGLGEVIDVSATYNNIMANLTIHPSSITPRKVAEITLIPSVSSINETFTVTVTAKRHGIYQTKTVIIEVIPGEDNLIQHAEEMRDMFTPWLSENYPELGIIKETGWTGTIVNPRILVVMHYIFYSDEWEIYLTWHVTIPPHDWTRIYLRRRRTELRSSYAFEISSIKGQEEPHLIEIPDWV